MPQSPVWSQCFPVYVSIRQSQHTSTYVSILTRHGVAHFLLSPQTSVYVITRQSPQRTSELLYSHTHTHTHTHTVSHTHTLTHLYVYTLDPSSGQHLCVDTHAHTSTHTHTHNHVLRRIWEARSDVMENKPIRWHCANVLQTKSIHSSSCDVVISVWDKLLGWVVHHLMREVLSHRTTAVGGLPTDHEQILYFGSLVAIICS